MAADFMSREVVSILKNSLVSKAVNAMNDRDIGSVVVFDSTGPCGVFTERDLLCRVLGKGGEPSSIALAEVLSPAFPAIDSRETLQGAAEAMVRKKSRLMVFEGADLAGILTSTDMLRAIPDQEADFSVDGVTTKRVFSTPPETPVDVVVREMCEMKIGCVLVDHGDGKRSIFTERDLLKRVVAPRLRLDIEVGRVASSPVVTAEVGVTGREASEMMHAQGIKRLPLSVDGSIVRIVTARDVVEAFARASNATPHLDWAQWN